jgi:hypothetical protein
MGPVYAEIEIDAPREQICDYLMDIATRPILFGDAIRDFRLLRLESTGVGAGARFRFKRRSTWIDTTITAVDHPRRISERGSGGHFNRGRNGFEWEIAESASGVSSVRLSYWTEPRGFARLTDRLTGGAGWYRRRLKHGLDRLRDRIETDRTGSDPIPVAGGNRYATGIR